MKRTLILMMVIGLVVGSVATAEAGKKKRKPKRVERTLEYRYDQPSIGAPGAGGVTVNPGIATGPDDLFVSIETTDDVSPSPSVRFSWDTDGDGQNDTGVTICGGVTEEPVPLPGSVELGVFTYILPGPDCPTGFSTTGTIKVTFSNMP